MSLMFGKKQNEIRAILGWSGGLDSTYNLWHLLKDTEYVVHAHHIRIMQKHRSNWEAEEYACKRIIDYIYNNFPRPGKKIEDCFVVTYGRYSSPTVTVDQDIVMFMLAQMALTCKQDCFAAYSIIKEDIQRAGEERGYYPWVGRELFRIAIQNGDFVWGKDKQPNKIYDEVQFMIKDISKRDCARGMPRELVDLTWSCRNPIKKSDKEFFECGECRACKERREALGA